MEWDYLFVNGVTINTPGDKEQIDSWSIFYWNGQIEVVFYSSYFRGKTLHLQNRESYSARNSKRLPFIKPSIHEVYLVLGQANLICQGCKKYLARIDRNIHTTSTYTLTHSVDKKGENFRKLHKKILYPSSLVIVSSNWIFFVAFAPRNACEMPPHQKFRVATSQKHQAKEKSLSRNKPMVLRIQAWLLCMVS